MRKKKQGDFRVKCGYLAFMEQDKEEQPLFPIITLKDRIAARILPIKQCCGKGCRKCNYGRWLKHRPRTWWVLLDEAIKRQPPWLWCIWLALTFALGFITGSK